jgi:hypothetical protein
MCVEQGENCRIGAGSALLSERITSCGSSSNKVSVLRVFSCTSVGATGSLLLSSGM